MWPALTVCTDNLVFNIIVPAGALLVTEIADTTGAGLLVTVLLTLAAAISTVVTIKADTTFVIGHIIFEIFITSLTGMNIARTVITRASIIILVTGLTQDLSVPAMSTRMAHIYLTDAAVPTHFIHVSLTTLTVLLCIAHVCCARYWGGFGFKFYSDFGDMNWI